MTVQDALEGRMATTAVNSSAGMAPAAPVVVARGLARTYTLGGVAVPALRGVDLEVAAGELVVLDVREADEFAAGHLPDSINIPAAKLVESGVDTTTLQLLLALKPSPVRLSAIVPVFRIV